MLASPDQRFRLTLIHSMATSGRGSGVVGYNVQSLWIRRSSDRHARGDEYRLDRHNLPRSHASEDILVLTISMPLRIAYFNNPGYASKLLR
jgi:hypothetical protein